MKQYKYLIILLFLFCLGKAHGQDSPFAVSMNYLHNKAENKPLTFSSNVACNLPLHHDSLFTFFTGASFKYYDINLSEDSLNIHHLYSVSLNFTGILRLSSSKTITLLIEPVLSSDFKDISAQDFRYNTAVFYRISNHHNSSWGIGIAATKRFSGFLIAPLVLVNIRFSDHWILSGSFPLKQKLSYVIKDKKQIGISLTANNNSFRMSEADNSRFVDSQELGASCFYQQELVKHIKLELSTGIQTHRTYVYDKGKTSSLVIYPLNFNKSESAIESFKSTGLLIHMSLSYTLH